MRIKDFEYIDACRVCGVVANAKVIFENDKTRSLSKEFNKMLFTRKE